MHAEPPPAPEGAPAPGAPQKRARESPGAEPQPKRPKAAAPAPKKRRNQTGEQHLRMLKKSVPYGARTLVAALQLHVCVIGGIVAPAAVLKSPNVGDVTGFEQRYKSIDEVMALRNSPNVRTPANDDMVQKLVDLRAAYAGTSTRAKQASRIPEPALRYVLGQLARFGLRSWRPNFHEDPYSLYNSAHRFFALDTFRQLVVSLAYDHMAVDKSFLDEMLLLTQAYDHYVHYHLFKVWQREQKYPGVAQAEMERDTVLARRRKTANDRKAFLESRNYPDWVCDLIGTPEATSDDEDGLAKIRGGTVAVWWIREKAERAEVFTQFVRWIDKTRKALKEQRTRQGPVQAIKQAIGAAERLRIVCPKQKISEEPLPTGIALDYYDVDKFNALDYSFRALFNEKPTIAMPKDLNLLIKGPDDEGGEDAIAWRLLSQADWMKKYGEERLKAYRIPPAQGIEVVPAAGGGGGGGGGQAEGEDAETIDVNPEMVSDQEKFAAAAKQGLGITQPSPHAAPRTGIPGRRMAGRKDAAVPKSGGTSVSGIPTRRPLASIGPGSRHDAGSGPAGGSGSRHDAGSGPAGGSGGHGASSAVGSGAASGASGGLEVFDLDQDVQMEGVEK